MAKFNQCPFGESGTDDEANRQLYCESFGDAGPGSELTARPQALRRSDSETTTNLTLDSTMTPMVGNGTFACVGRPIFANVDDTPFELTPYQKQLIRKTWKEDDATLYELGTNCYAYVFVRHPDSKQLFPTADAAGDDWRESEIFREQGYRFARLLSHVVRYLNHRARLTSKLMHVGQMHQKYAVDRGFKPEDWDILLDALKVVMGEHIHKSFPQLDSDDLDQLMRAWVTTSEYIVSIMKKGYYSTPTLHSSKSDPVMTNRSMYHVVPR